MEYFLQQLINGVTLGSIYGLIAIGYTMVYGIIGMINFAHGEIFMIGSFIALTVFLALAAIGITFLPLVGALLVMGYLGITLTGAGAIVALAWVYASRFTTSGAEPMVAALGRAPASMGYAAESLGASPLRRAVSDSGMVSATTSSSSTDPLMLSTAGPDRIGCVA